jgi:hypothetical protein
VPRIFRGELLDLLSRKLGIELYRLEKWRDAALAGMEEALKTRATSPGLNYSRTFYTCLGRLFVP